MFIEKIKNIAPVLENSVKLGRFTVKKYSRLINMNIKKKSELEIPYIDEMTDFLEKNNGCIGKGLLIVTDNVNVAIKAMAYARVHMDEYYEEEGCFYGYDFDEIVDDEEDVSDMVRVVNFSNLTVEEKTAVNKYLPLISEVRTDDMVIFTGITDETDIKDRMEVISACPAQNICVHINSDLLNQEWVHMLQIDYGFNVLRLSAPDNKYYEKCVKYLLNDEEVRLSRELPLKRLVQYVYKNKGNSLKEEDIAWYMDKALNNCLKRNGKKILKSDDFGLLLGDLENPFTVLDNMTGLTDLKKTARELAAVTKEELRNDKLGVFHKNMIFVGNPGTGKTTGARLLADIMAWDGNSNSKFVIADRKKIIGKYVGHTAPKIAQLFEEAKGGVLFVDEAGFFLNRESGGYVDEAVKEFVRYMELYPQVMVIFAMYSDEIKDFLNLDSGLTSRISRFVKFDDYNNEELTVITTDMLKKNGYEVGQEMASLIKQGIEKLNKGKVKSFGNARGARNLAESIIIMASMRRYESAGKTDIQHEDVKKAVERLRKELKQKNNTFGFVNEESGKTKLAY